MRKFMINVNGNSYEVEVEEILGGASSVSAPVVAAAPKQAAPVAAAPAPAAPKVEKKEVVASAGQEVVSAPMPGTILKVMAKEGQEVKAGEILVILEAMKMENEIVAPRAGKVASIVVSVGATVNSGEKLVIID